MNKAKRILNEQERRQLVLLSLLLIIAIVFLSLATVGQKRSFRRLATELERKEKALAAAEAKRAAAAAEWSRWEQTVKDLAEIRGQYFYRDEEGVNVLRLDLEKILSETGASAASIRYDYVDQAREREKKVLVTFTVSGSYAGVKKLLATIEQFPKFLIIENVDFIKISNEGNLLELRITLAGHYEQS